MVLVKPANDTGRPALLAERLGLGRYYFPRPGRPPSVRTGAFLEVVCKVQGTRGLQFMPLFKELQGT